MSPVPWPHPRPQSNPRPPQVTSLIPSPPPLVHLLPGPSLDLCSEDRHPGKEKWRILQGTSYRHVFANIVVLLGVKVLEFLYTKFFIKMNDNNLVLSCFWLVVPRVLLADYDPGLLSYFLWASDSNEHLVFEIPSSSRSCVIFGTWIHSGLVAARMSQTSPSMGSSPSSKKKNVLSSITPRVYRSGWWAGPRSAKTLSELVIHFAASAMRMQ